MLALILSLFSVAQASENWLCVTQASKVQGTTVLACGVGSGKDEDQARTNAFNSAKLEFERICSASNDCEPKNYAVEPKRTTCDQDGSEWKCYRLLAYAFQSVRPSKDGKPSRNPKIKKGMTKQELMAQFGKPIKVLIASWTAFVYEDKSLCSSSSCNVYLEKDVVVAWSDDVRIAVTDILD